MTSTQEYLTNHNRSLTVEMELDLGELVPGHHVVLLGIEHRREAGTNVEGSRMVDLLHFEHRPGLTELREVSDWHLVGIDDLGNRYAEAQLGGYEKVGGGPSSFGERDLGRLSPEAAELTLQIIPARDWIPPGVWVRRIVIDLTGFQDQVNVKRVP